MQHANRVLSSKNRKIKWVLTTAHQGCRERVWHTMTTITINSNAACVARLLQYMVRSRALPHAPHELECRHCAKRRIGIGMCGARMCQDIWTHASSRCRHHCTMNERNACALSEGSPCFLCSVLAVSLAISNKFKPTADHNNDNKLRCRTRRS